MCSIVGFVARKGHRLNFMRLAELIAGNESRGPHAFGFSWVDENGRIRSYKQPGKFSAHAGLLGIMSGARMVIAHLRWATHGSADENINNHPHPVDGGWLVHNGVVTNQDELVVNNRLWQSSDCDTEVIGMLAENSPEKTRRMRMEDAVTQTTGSCCVLALWGGGDPRLIAVKRGNPLCVFNANEGVYLASTPEGMPARNKHLEVVVDGTSMEYSYANDGRMMLTKSGVPVEHKTYTVTGTRGRRRDAADWFAQNHYNRSNVVYNGGRGRELPPTAPASLPTAAPTETAPSPAAPRNQAAGVVDDHGYLWHDGVGRFAGLKFAGMTADDYRRAIEYGVVPADDLPPCTTAGAVDAPGDDDGAAEMDADNARSVEQEGKIDGSYAGG